MARPALCSAVLPEELRGSDSVSHHKSASVVMPNSRCAVTMSGFNCQVTVSMPSSACTSTVANSASTCGTLTTRARRAVSASTVMSTMIAASVPAA